MTLTRAVLVTLLLLATREATAQSVSATPTQTLWSSTGTSTASASGSASGTPTCTLTPGHCTSTSWITFTVVGSLGSAYNGAVFMPDAVARANYTLAPGSPVFSAHVTTLGTRYLYFTVSARGSGRGNTPATHHA